MQDLFKMSPVFQFQLPRKVIFGNEAAARVGEEARAAFGGRTVLLISDRGVKAAGLTQGVEASLAAAGYRVVLYDQVAPDAPLSRVLECAALGRREKADVVVGLGGGSTIDTAKAVSFMVPWSGDIREQLGNNQVTVEGLPKVFIPTTAGTGSELSHTFVLYDDTNHVKLTSYSPRTFADLAIIDPTLTLNLPPRVTAESGVDAFSHALESYVTVKANPLSELLSLRGVEMIARHLRRAYTAGPSDLEARYAMCFGVSMGTMAIRSSGVGAIHATCYPPAARHQLSHGVAIALLMPAVMRYNLTANPAKYAAVAEVMGEDLQGLSQEEAAQAAVSAVSRLIADVGLPTRLREVGVKREDFPGFAATVLGNYPHHIANNPRPAGLEDLVAIYESAY
ncbi:MAG: iron-containing alcohol dehydrogenase [Deltaproteobacteria bacterium]|nr:iron-containing alcohol dehydrogenase [Deltaproteobacteria bacterium]